MKRNFSYMNTYIEKKQKTNEQYKKIKIINIVTIIMHDLNGSSILRIKPSEVRIIRSLSKNTSFHL